MRFATRRPRWVGLAISVFPFVRQSCSRIRLEPSHATYNQGSLASGIEVFFFKQKTAYEMDGWLEFRRVLFRSLLEAVSRLKKGDDVMKYCVEAKQLEEEGDSIYHEALGQLFEKERDAIELIKWKEIYDNLEGTLDQAEDVANVVESITIKHA